MQDRDDVMSTVISGSNDRAEVRSTEELVAQVVELSEGIRRGVIDAVDRMSEINRSIHLLSMNARTEAARVGSAGAGFAVVAEELTRLSAGMKLAATSVVGDSRTRGAELQAVLQELNQDVVSKRLCDLAYNAIDVVDRNLYERSCDVRCWAAEPSVVAALRDPSPDNLQYAGRRLGQILDSYTVYSDLVIADAAGRVIVNGRPKRFRSVGVSVGRAQWFRSALATTRGSEFGFQSMHDSELVNGQSTLAYSCAVRESDGREPLGVLGILFNWRALGQTVVEQIPLSASEWARSRACLVDDDGRVLADAGFGAGGRQLEFPERKALFLEARGSVKTYVGGQPVVVCHAASPGFETYRTGWHALLLRSEA